LKPDYFCMGMSIFFHKHRWKDPWQIVYSDYSEFRVLREAGDLRYFIFALLFETYQ